MKEEFIRKELATACGSGEESEVYLEVEISTGQSELVIKKSIIERYPVQDYEKVMDLHKRLNRGGGRRVWSLEDLTK